MQIRKLGKDLEVSAVGLGCMGLSHAFGTPLEKQEAADKVRQVRASGVSGIRSCWRPSVACALTAARCCWIPVRRRSADPSKEV